MLYLRWEQLCEGYGRTLHKRNEEIPHLQGLSRTPRKQLFCQGGEQGFYLLWKGEN